MVRLSHGYRFKNGLVIVMLLAIDGLLRLMRLEKRPLPEVPGRILLIKPDHLGDMLMLTSVLPLLRQRYPHAAIDLACQISASEILKLNPYINKYIQFEHPLYLRRRPGITVTISGLIAAFKEIKVGKYDLCLNMRDAAGDMILLAKLAGCGCIAGHSTGGFGPLLDILAPWQEGRHEVEHYLEVLEAIGIKGDITNCNYLLYPSGDDALFVEHVLERFEKRPFVVIHPGSGDVRKLRSPREWAKVADTFPEETCIAITGTREEYSLFKEITGLTNHPIVNLTGELNIQQLALLFRKAEHVYALDSLAAHLAAFSGVSATIFWPFFNDLNQWRPLGGNLTFIETVQGTKCE